MRRGISEKMESYNMVAVEETKLKMYGVVGTGQANGIYAIAVT